MKEGWGKDGREIGKYGASKQASERLGEIEREEGRGGRGGKGREGEGAN